jgi:hypothetical protein
MKPEAAKPAQLVIQTSPSAEVYLDDIFRGKASAEGRLVIDNPQPREHALRISLAGKKDSRQNGTIVAGQEARIEVLLESNAPPAFRLAGAERATMGEKGVRCLLFPKEWV